MRGPSRTWKRSCTVRTGDESPDRASSGVADGTGMKTKRLFRSHRGTFAGFLAGGRESWRDRNERSRRLSPVLEVQGAGHQGTPEHRA
jgi:hypothetical protein